MDKAGAALSDYPWTHYFNGEAMPCQAPYWSRVMAAVDAEEFMVQRGNVGASHELWCISCRIGHAVNIESADPGAFRLCCLTLAYLMMRDGAAVRSAVSDDGIYDGVLEGLFIMHRLSMIHGMAFWTNGHEANRQALLEYMWRNRLPPDDPDWLEAPHLLLNRGDLNSQTNRIRGDLIDLLGKRPISKELRRRIHEIPKLRD